MEKAPVTATAAKQLAFAFDRELTLAYMSKMLVMETEREDINKQITTMRQEARDMEVPAKAVESAIRAAKARRKSLLNPVEFQWLMDQAETLLEEQAHTT